MMKNEVNSQDVVDSYDVEFWIEYEATQGIIDAEREAREEEELAAHYDELARQYGLDLDCYGDCDDSQACYNALTNDPQEWK